MSLSFEERAHRASTGTIQDKKDFAYHCLQAPARYMTALHWFRAAADAGDAEAQYMVGVFYMGGMGKPPNLTLTEQWFMKAAQNGFAKARDMLKEVFPGRDFDFSAAPPAAEDEKPAQGFSFRDLAFKKDENGNLSVNVVDIDALQTDADAPSPDRNGLEWDEAYYDNLQLKIIEPDLTRDPFKDLESLTGLPEVKHQIDIIRKRMEFEKKRLAAGLEATPHSNHFLFVGNPGTGKNEVARILGHMLHSIGILERGHVVEVDRGDLVAGWVGHTALKTRSAIKKAKGGILFIDEAYTLHDDDHYDMGGEAIATLMKSMEDERDQYIVVLAGYPKEMNELLRSNPGFKSRIRHHLAFSDFKADELVEIFERQCANHHYILHPDAKLRAHALMKEAIKLENKTLGNGRFTRNVFEKAIEYMARRVMNAPADTPEDLQTILFSDIPTLADVTGIKNPQKPTGGDIHTL